MWGSEKEKFFLSLKQVLAQQNVKTMVVISSTSGPLNKDRLCQGKMNQLISVNLAAKPTPIFVFPQQLREMVNYLMGNCYKKLLHDDQVFILATKLENVDAIRDILENQNEKFHDNICFILDGKKFMVAHDYNTEINDTTLECRQCFSHKTTGM
jgi:hypothetical protein